MWHCPHCGAPQAETARCWVCRKSSTTCSTCRHFRASLVCDVGYCALDRARGPLTGLELRGCWTQPPATAGGPGTPAAESPGGAGRRPALPVRGFVPLEDAAPPGQPEPVAPPIILLADPIESWETRSSLFGDLDRQGG
jgi:hypothetical protein